MSAVLGHIHYWLYKKIRLVLEREQMLVGASDTAFDGIGEELESTINTMFGKPLPENVPLERAIDHNNIHGWLQTQVTTCEAREATLIKDLCDCFGAEAQQLIFDTFTNHGFACGLRARDTELAALREGDTAITAKDIYQILQDYLLNGMPCDQADNILNEDPRYFVWMGNHRQQRLIWARIGVPSNYMAKAYRHWILSFLEALNIDAEYKVDDRVEPFTYSIRLQNR